MHPYSMGVNTVVGTSLQLISSLLSPNRRLDRSRPAMMAVGVSSSLPSTTSPIAQTSLASVVSLSYAMIFPFLAVLTPTLSRANPSVSALLPIANMTVSKVSSISSSPCLKVTTFLPALFLVIAVGTDFFKNFTPCPSIQSPILLASCWSKPLKKIDLTITVTSMPKPFRYPAHSKAMQEAPTMRVLPGFSFIQKMSSEEIPNSLAPGISGQVGRPPVAMRILSAVTVEVLPSASVSSSVLGPANLASLFKYSTFQVLRLLRYPKFRDFIQSVIFSEATSQLFFTFAGYTCHPAPSRSPSDSPKRLVQWKSFLGIHPTLTQVPPNPHLVPAGEGLTKSARPTLTPNAAAARELASPPEPPPITKYWQWFFS